MRNRAIILVFLLALPVIILAQTKFGPTVKVGYIITDKTSKNYDISGGVSPSFGVAMQNEVNYWLSIRSSLRYTFSQINTSTNPGGLKDQIKGQFIDLTIAGRFSGFDESSKVLPYGIAGFGNSFNLLSKGAESYLSDTNFKGYVPFFTVGAGISIKMTYFSEFDFCLVYNRYLAPVLTLPDDSGVRLNMVCIEISALF